MRDDAVLGRALPLDRGLGPLVVWPDSVWALVVWPDAVWALVVWPDAVWALVANILTFNENLQCCSFTWFSQRFNEHNLGNNRDHTFHQLVLQETPGTSLVHSWCRTNKHSSLNWRCQYVWLLVCWWGCKAWDHGDPLSHFIAILLKFTSQAQLPSSWSCLKASSVPRGWLHR